LGKKHGRNRSWNKRSENYDQGRKIQDRNKKLHDKIQELSEKNTEEVKEAISASSLEIKKELNTDKDIIVDKLEKYVMGIIATNLWMLSQNTQLLYLVVKNISEMKRSV
jgi:hypothetical protein